MKKITNIRKAIKATRGRIFKAEFIKKNGDYRVMLARTGVTKGLKYSDRKRVNSSTHAVVYDMEKQGFRTIILDSIVSLQMYGKKFSVHARRK